MSGGGAREAGGGSEVIDMGRNMEYTINCLGTVTRAFSSNATSILQLHTLFGQNARTESRTKVPRSCLDNTANSVRALCILGG